jgi:hypothetical protein
MPTKKPCGEELTLAQQMANQALHQRRLRIEHVNSSVKRCRIVKDRIRLWKQGVRDLVMELCCALHNFRVRLTPGSQRFNRDKLNSIGMSGMGGGFCKRRRPWEPHELMWEIVPRFAWSSLGF